MEKELTVRDWKAWEDRESDGDVLRDGHGNYKGSVVFEEHSGEQVDATFKEQPKPGDKKYGVIEDYQTKAGKTRTKFSRRDRPQENQTTFVGHTASSQKPAWQPRDDGAIKAQFAIKTSVAFHGSEASMKDIEDTAKTFYEMVDRVKNSIKPDVVDEFIDDLKDEINLDDIPF